MCCLHAKASFVLLLTHCRSLLPIVLHMSGCFTVICHHAKWTRLESPWIGTEVSWIRHSDSGRATDKFHRAPKKGIGPAKIPTCLHAVGYSKPTSIRRNRACFALESEPETRHLKDVFMCYGSLFSTRLTPKGFLESFQDMFSSLTEYEA